MKRAGYLGLMVTMIALMSTLAMSACVSTAGVAGVIQVSGPGDLYYLSMLLNQQSENAAAVPQVNMTVSADSINELKEGKVQAVFLGREPTATELQGLTDYVIAYDAVCVIIDESSYTGGTTISAGHPQIQNAGFRELTSGELKEIISGAGWVWNGAYYVYNVNLDPNSWLLTLPGVAWIQQPKTIINSFIFPVGKFDTQTVLYQDLGLDETSLLNSQTAFTDPQYDKEEEILAYEYNGSNYSTEYGAQAFPFKLGFASRRVMTIAPLHIPVKILPIDGIDPLASPQSVYDGTYKFCRKIHLLVRQNSPDSVLQIAQYLESQAGQKALADVGCLPLPLS